MCRLISILLLMFVSGSVFGQEVRVDLSGTIPGDGVIKSTTSIVDFTVPVDVENLALAVTLQVDLAGGFGSQAYISYGEGDEFRYADQISIGESGTYIFDISRGVRAAQLLGVNSQDFTLSFTNAEKGSTDSVRFKDESIGIVQYVYAPALVHEHGSLDTANPDNGSPGDVATPRSNVVTVSPNPFNPRTVISLDIVKGGRVSLDIYNLAGARVKSIYSAWLSVGVHDFVWSGHDDSGRRASSGTYFYRVMIGAGEYTGKLTLLK